ncbi:hypothetical protein EDB85DRAFT_1895036 [Lactarius pseudohatsudake]|nr:hypothetical protein EDB85DRAFT_1895036 [Lactarius pseudohatsudake]
MGGGLYWRNTGGIQSRFRWSTCQKNRSSTTGLNLVRLVRRLEKSINGRLGYGTQLDAIPQIGECAIATGARPKIAGKRGARQRDSTFGMSARHHNLEAQTQEDLDADWLNAQKAREAPRGHPRTAGQARHVYALCERAAADVDLLLSSAHEPSAFLLPDRTPSTTGGRNTGGDAASASAVLQHSAALQEELAAHVAGQLRRNAEHFSRRAGGGPEGVRRVAEEKEGEGLGKVAQDLKPRRDARTMQITEQVLIAFADHGSKVKPERVRNGRHAHGFGRGGEGRQDEGGKGWKRRKEESGVEEGEERRSERAEARGFGKRETVARSRTSLGESRRRRVEREEEVFYEGQSDDREERT